MMQVKDALSAISKLSDTNKKRYYASVVQVMNKVPVWIENELRYENVKPVRVDGNANGDCQVRCDIQYHGCPID